MSGIATGQLPWYVESSKAHLKGGGGGGRSTMKQRSNCFNLSMILSLII